MSVVGNSPNVAPRYRSKTSRGIYSSVPSLNPSSLGILYMEFCRRIKCLEVVTVQWTELCRSWKSKVGS